MLPTGQEIDGSLPGRRGDPPRRRARRCPSPRSCRATRSACPAAPATRRAARASAAASASRSASRTSATRRASTTTAPRASSVRADGSRRGALRRRRGRAGRANVILQVARTELGTDDVVARAARRRRPSARPARRRRRGMTWMAAGAVQRRLPRGARGARARSGGGEVDVERVYRHPPTTRSTPRRARSPASASHVAFAVRGDAGRRRGGRRARGSRASSGSARRRTSAGRSTRRPSRARSRAAPRRASGSR